MRFEAFRVQTGTALDLATTSTTAAPLYKSKRHYQKLLGEHVAGLSSLQQLLYASSPCAILVIFQAMDAAGKDGAIKHVMSGVNPQGCQVTSFKHPTSVELKHDFLEAGGAQRRRPARRADLLRLAGRRRGDHVAGEQGTPREMADREAVTNSGNALRDGPPWR